MATEGFEDAKEALEVLDEALLVVEERAAEILAAERREFSLIQVAELLEQAATMKKRIADVEKNLVTALERERHREEFVPLPNGGGMQLEYAAGGKSWKHDSIKPVVVQAIVDRHTDDEGNLTAPVDELLRELLSTVGVSYWKVGELDRYDIDANDYSTKKPSKFKYKVHRND